QTAMLLRQLKCRFSDIPSWVEEKIAAASSSQIEQWSERIFDAHAPGDLFGT
ncbi:MAG: DUF4351 domain-containing protein, partial [Magnetococcales bacterium]|nr:DUF4351 domain-containing protein [Magnetococcales bacterium]